MVLQGKAKVWPLLMAVVIFALLNVGCGPSPTTAVLQKLDGLNQAVTGLTNTLGATTKVASDLIKDQGVIDSLIARAGGHANNPGVRLSIGTEQYLEAKAIGVDGEFKLGVDGHGTFLPPESRAFVIDAAAKGQQWAIELLIQERREMAPPPGSQGPRPVTWGVAPGMQFVEKETVTVVGADGTTTTTVTEKLPAASVTGSGAGG